MALPLRTVTPDGVRAQRANFLVRTNTRRRARGWLWDGDQSGERRDKGDLNGPGNKSAGCALVYVVRRRKRADQNNTGGQAGSRDA